MNLELLNQEFIQALNGIEKNKPHHFTAVSKVLDVSTSVAVRRSSLAMTSNYITCMSFSAGAETQQTLC